MQNHPRSYKLNPISLLFPGHAPIRRMLPLLLAIILLPALAHSQDTEMAFGGISKNRELYYDAAKQKILGRFDKAAALFEKCLELDPTDAASMYELAYIYFTQGNMEKSVPLAEKAVKTDPSNEYYKVLLVQIYQSTARYTDAEKC